MKAVKAVELIEALFWQGTAPVTLNEPEVMAVRIIDIYRVQHPRCKVQHPSEMAKQCRTTFRNACMDLKRNSTIGHHSPVMGSRRRATVILFYRKNPRVEKTKGKKLTRPDWDSGCPFWALIFPLMAESCQRRRTHRGLRFDRLWLP